MRNILTEFGYFVCYDNKSGINVSKNSEHYNHMKHLYLQPYWLEKASLITPVYVSTHNNVANLFIKAVQSQVVKFVVPKLGPVP